MLITVSIVLYNNNVSEIKNVIDSIIKCTNLKMIIYLVDNSLNDDLKILKTYKTGDNCSIQYIFLNNNIGFGAAHNVALKTALEKGSKYHLIINPDIYFGKGVIESIIQKMELSESIGLLMPKVLYPNGEIQYLCKLIATPFDLLLRRFIPNNLFSEHRKFIYEFRFADYNLEMTVPSLSGCFMTLRMDVIKKIGGFDERYFMYMEDLDLCRRIGEDSQTVFFPDVEVYHAYEKGSYKNRKLLYYHISSAVKYFNKWGWIFDAKRVKMNKRALKQL